MYKFMVLCVAGLALTACVQERDPGYVCMTNCAHQCQDGIKGDNCRANIDQQKRDNNDNSNYDN